MMVLSLLAVSLLAGPRAELSVGAGGSSNPFELPTDTRAASATSRPEGGAFLPVKAGLQIRTASDRMFRIEALGRFDGEFFAYVRQDPAATATTSASDASRWTGYAAVPIRFDPLPEKRKGVRGDLTLQPFVGLRRETFTSHRSGLPFTSGGVSLADRYSTNRYGAQLEGDLAIGRNWDVLAGVQMQRIDYIEDYESSATDSWDHDEVKGSLDGRASRKDWELRAGYAFRRKDYDERFPRDPAGNLVVAGAAGYEPQVFTSHDFSIGGGFSGKQGRAILTWELTRRIDEFVGYLDYTENRFAADLRLTMGESSELRVEPSLSLRGYDSARVNYDPAEPSSDRQRFGIDTSFEWPLFRKWTWGFAQAGFVDQSSSNPLYTYRDFRAATGIRVEWK